MISSRKQEKETEKSNFVFFLFIRKLFLNRNPAGLTQRCIWVMLALIVAFILAAVIAGILAATLIKHDTTITSTTSG
jgi:hypothetical protein